MSLEQSVKQLIVELDSPIAEVAEAAQVGLAALGGEATDALLAALEHPRRGLRVGAALTLGRMAEARAVPRLIQIAEADEDVTVRPLALRALSDIASADAADELKIFFIRQLGGDDMFARALACRGLTKVGDATAQQALRLAVEDKEKWVRDAAREGLAQIALGAGREGSGRAAEGADDRSSSNETALARREGSPPQAELAMLQSLDAATQRRGQQALVARGEPIVAEVARLLWAPEASTRRAAAELLGRVGGAQAAEQLAQLLENDELEAGTRAATLYALGQAGGRPDVAVEELPVSLVEAHLDDPDAYVRAAAVVCLLRIGGAPRRLATQALIDDEDEWVHIAGLRALAELASSADRPLRDTLVSGMARITEVSAQTSLLVALAKIIDPPHADDQLIVGPASFFLDSEEEAVRQAALLLVLSASRQLDPALLTRVHGMLDSDAEAELLIARTLRRMARPGEEASVALLSLLLASTDAATVEAAVAALATVGGAAAVDALVALANSPRSAAQLAVEALDALDPDAEVIALCDSEGRWERQLQPRCPCGGSPQWVKGRGEREELRCPECDSEFVMAASGRIFGAHETPFGTCLCCRRKQPLVRGGEGQTLVCPVTNEVHIRPHDAPRQILRLSDLPLGACRCCDEPQPLVPVAEKVVCRRTRTEHVAGPSGYQLPNEGPGVAADIDAINAALLAGSLDIGQSGLPVTGEGSREED